MKHPVPDEVLAHALAMFVAANGRIDDRELGVLDRLDAFQCIGVSRDRFVDIARSCLSDVCAHLSDRSWLGADQTAYIDALLDAIPDTEDRVLLCRLACAVITADGSVTHDERLIYDHTRARWRISPPDVSQSVLHDPAARGSAAPP